jgi:hypothetical protein
MSLNKSNFCCFTLTAGMAWGTSEIGRSTCLRLNLGLHARNFFLILGFHDFFLDATMYSPTDPMRI